LIAAVSVIFPLGLREPRSLHLDEVCSGRVIRHGAGFVMLRPLCDWRALGSAVGVAAPFDPAAAASWARRPASRASEPVIGLVAAIWVVRFVVRFVGMAFSP
jgi:hypothetical protein